MDINQSWPVENQHWAKTKKEQKPATDSISLSELLSALSVTRAALDKIAYCENTGTAEEGLYCCRELARMALEAEQTIFSDNTRSAGSDPSDDFND
ncbi:hypothetical protein N8Z76_00480 [Gammaproteobacteria bacterium]|nr:hypothetical protein [Gammaproteobacteria bacterium]